jgi:hypothetical protein
MSMKEAGGRPHASADADRSANNLEIFHAETDWPLWFWEFCSAADERGGPKFQSTDQLAKSKAQNEPQFEFLKWYLGPLRGGNFDSRFAFASPQDWAAKRDSAWSSNAQQDPLVRAFAAERDPVAAMGLVGNSVVLTELIRWVQFGKTVDLAFMGQLFNGNLNLPQNVTLAGAYANLHSKRIEPIVALVGLLAKTRGVNFDDMEGTVGLLHLRAEIEARADRHKQEEAGYGKLLRDLHKMALVKSAKFGIRLPAGMQHAVEEAYSELNGAADDAHSNSEPADGSGAPDQFEKKQRS